MKNYPRNTFFAGASAIALFASLGPASAQSALTDEELSNLNDACRQMLINFDESGQTPEEFTAADLLRLARENVEADCANANEQMASMQQEDGQQTDQAQASETETDSATATAQAEDEAIARETVTVQEQALIEGQARVIVPQPDVDVDMQAPNVRVTKVPPEVNVTGGETTIEVEQRQPEIAVEIPEIIVRVEIPAPRVYIQSEDPNIEVAMGDPEVEVEQGEPNVSVTQGEPEIAVDLDVEGGEGVDGEASRTASASGTGGEEAEGANVNIRQGTATVEIVETDEEPATSYQSGEPTVSFAGADPNVTVEMSQQPQVEISNVGDIEVIFETPEQRDQRRQQQQANASGSSDQQMNRQETASASADATQSEDQQAQQTASNSDGASADSDLPDRVTVGELEAMTVVGMDGENVGTVEGFIREGDALTMILAGGDMDGVDGKMVGVPLNRVNYTPEELQLTEWSLDDISDAEAWEEGSTEYVDKDFEIIIGQ